jgi:WD40 repeat protein
LSPFGSRTSVPNHDTCRPARQDRASFDDGNKGAGALTVQPDDTSLASGAWDKVVKLWDVATGKERSRFQGHAGQVMAVAFAPDGHVLATGSRDGTVKLWEVRTGKELASLKTGGLSLAFSPDGTPGTARRPACCVEQTLLRLRSGVGLRAVASPAAREPC